MKKIKPILCLILPLFSLSLFSCNQEKEDINSGNNGTTDVITKALKIKTLPTKSEYIVGETLSFAGLEIELVTTTNGIKDEGVTYTSYSTSVEEGYEFSEADITTSTDLFVVNIIPNEENIRGVSLEFVVKEDPNAFKEVSKSPFTFLSEIKDNVSYTVESDELSGVITKNALYWKGKADESISFGYAFRESDNRIILFEENGSSYSILHDFGTNYSGFSDPSFQANIGENYVGFNCFNTPLLTESDFEYYSKLTRVKGTNDYKITPSKNYIEDSEGNLVYDTPVCHLLKLVSINQVFKGDLGLYNLNRSARYTLSMLSEDSMRFLVQGVSDFSWGDNPKDSIITKVNNLEISCIKGFLNNTDEGSVGKEPGEDNDIPSTSDPSEEKGVY